MLANKLKRKLEEMRLLELQLFINEFNRASQLDWSFSNSHKPKSGFRKGLVKTCLKQYVFLTQKFDCVKEDGYKNYQNLFDKQFALKVLKDEKYDKQRINNYVGGEI